MVYVAPGEHVVRATASNGSPLLRRLTVTAGSVASVSLAPVEAPATTTTTTTSSAVIPAMSPVDRDVGVAKSRGLSPWFVVAGGAATAAAGSLAIAFGIGTVESRNAFRMDPTPERYDAAMRDQTRTNVALVTTGAFALVTGAVALFLVDWKGR